MQVMSVIIMSDNVDQVVLPRYVENTIYVMQATTAEIKELLIKNQKARLKFRKHCNVSLCCVITLRLYPEFYINEVAFNFKAEVVFKGVFLAYGH